MKLLTSPHSIAADTTAGQLNSHPLLSNTISSPLNSCLIGACVCCIWAVCTQKMVMLLWGMTTHDEALPSGHQSESMITMNPHCPSQETPCGAGASAAGLHSLNSCSTPWGDYSDSATWFHNSISEGLLRTKIINLIKLPNIYTCAHTL